MSTQRAHVTSGKASLIGGIVVAIATMVLWAAVTRDLGFQGALSLGIGVAVSVAAGIWTRLADL
jgi:low affinity Fe/Cu permease